MKQLSSGNKIAEYFIIIAIVFIALICFLPGLGMYGMLDPTDSFFVEAAREMMECHHYFTPLINYTEWLDKPALPFWLIIMSYKVFGVSTWAARLPSALSGVLTVIATYFFTKRFIGIRGAFLSAFVLCTSPLFLIVGHVALTDEPLCLLLSIALLYFCGIINSENAKISVFAYLFLALAVLCKGPIALVLTGSTIILYLLITSNSYGMAQNKFWQLRPIIGFLILLLLCFPYYYLAHATTNGAFTTQFFLRQNLGRFQGTVNHQEPIWFYVPVILGGYAPWIICFFLAFPWLKKLFDMRLQLNQEQKFIMFCLCWLFSVIALFTAIPTKLPTYILPFSPAFAIVVGYYLNLLLDTGKFKKLIYGLCAVSLVACTILVPVGFSWFCNSYQAKIDRLITIAQEKNGRLATLFSSIPSAIYRFKSPIPEIQSLAELPRFCQAGSGPHFLLSQKNCLLIPELKAKEHTVAKEGKWYLLSVDGYPW